jgi:adenylate cyclase
MESMTQNITEAEQKQINAIMHGIGEAIEQTHNEMGMQTMVYSDGTISNLVSPNTSDCDVAICIDGWECECDKKIMGSDECPDVDMCTEKYEEEIKEYIINNRVVKE